MNQVRKWNIIGGRVIKQELRFSYSSSLRIFQYTNYFAVITAIVTIEPTATDSIKRTSSFSSFNNWIGVCNDFHIFPRSSGSSYALAAMFTIVTCQN